MCQTKMCSKCKKEKDLTLFDKSSKMKCGYSSACKSCKKQYRDKNKESTSLYKKEYYENKKQDLFDYRNINKEKINERNREYYRKNKTVINEKSRVYQKKKRDEDSLYKLNSNIRNLIVGSFKRAKNQFHKDAKTESILGCTIQELIEHLKSLFTEGMTLENHGKCEECWQIDHNVPISSAKTEEEIIKLNHYTNLQPLWRGDNLKKGSKY